MTNLLTVLPELDIKSYTHLVPSLERALISTADLLTLEPLDVAKRAQLPPGEVKRLSDAVFAALKADLGPANVAKENGLETSPRAGQKDGQAIKDSWNVISTLDDQLDVAFGGGIAPGYLTEIVGESAVGKTQFLLTLLLSVQLPPPHGLGKSALYISTEAPLQTTRLTQILKNHPKLSTLSDKDLPSLSRIHSTHIHDVEAQEHILRYQVPVAIKKQNVGLLVVDSIAANYRAEFDRSNARNGAESFARRSNQLFLLGALLRNIAKTSNVAIVVANQVADRFITIEPSSQAPNISQSTSRSRPDSPPHPLVGRLGPMSSAVPLENPAAPQMLSTDDPLALDHQQRFFTGWGDDPAVTNFKTPSLGLTWTNQLATRIALLKKPIYEDKHYQPGEDRDLLGWSRTARVVFSAWGAEGKVDFEIAEGGVRAVDVQDESSST